MGSFENFIFNVAVICIAFGAANVTLRLIQVAFCMLRANAHTVREQVLDYKKYISEDNLIPVSFIVPTYNSEHDIVGCIERILGVDYVNSEIIIVNDGSTDSTLEVISEYFELEEIEYSIKTSIPTKKIRSVYYSKKYPNILVVNKSKGGRFDAANCGINVSQYPLIICLDVSSYLEKDSVLKLAVEFLKNSYTVMSSGFVRLTAKNENGDYKSPRNRFPVSLSEGFEAMRCIKAASTDKMNAFTYNFLFSGTGSFAVFAKQAIIDVGGYSVDVADAHLDLLYKISNFFAKNKRKYKFVLHHDVICRTGNDYSSRAVIERYKEWQTGLLDALLCRQWRTLAHPFRDFKMFLSGIYNWMFEVINVLLIVVSVIAIPIALIAGVISFKLVLCYILFVFFLNLNTNFGAFLVELNIDNISRHHCRMYIKIAFLDNFGFRLKLLFARFATILSYSRPSRRAKLAAKKAKRQAQNI